MAIFLSFIILILFFTILVLIARANELTQSLKDGKADYTSQSRFNGYLLLVFLIAMFIGSAICYKILAPVMLPKAASIHGVKTDLLFNVTMLIILVVFLLTQVALFYFAYRYNESRVDSSYFYPHNNKLEVVWTLIPSVVLTGLITMGLYEWFSIFNVEDRSKNKLVVEATAKQFNWMLRYPGKDLKFGKRIIDTEHITPTNELGIDWTDANSHDDFFSDKMYLVKDRPVLVKIGALDVIHSFFLPHFRVKMDAVPGIPTEFYFTPTMTTKEMQEYLSTQPWWQTINPESGQPRWQTFKYELACAELCGKSHYGMQREVVVVSQQEYDQWLSKQTPIYASLAPAAAETAATDSTATENKQQALLAK